MAGSKHSAGASSPERWGEIERLLDAALELPAGERDTFLEHSCAGDAELRYRVERLLQACAKAHRFLEVPAPEFAAPLLAGFAAAGDAPVEDARALGRSAVSARFRERLQAALGGTYVIERELAPFGSSRVFVAEEIALGRQVVLKVLAPELAAGLDAKRFCQEIRLPASLEHPHVVPLLSAQQAAGLLFYTMPLVEGESLRARLVRWGELSLSQAVPLLRDIADALAYAHRLGVVHGDLRPEHILLAERHALVTDVGVARALSVATKSGEASALIGLAPGVPAYTAPEQAAADPAADGRADIYALGVVAYEILTGAPPFSGRSSQALVAAHVMKAPEHVTRRRPSVPPALAALIMRCLEKRPADRPQTADQVVHALDAWTGRASDDAVPLATAGSARAATRPTPNAPLARGGMVERRMTLRRLALGAGAAAARALRAAAELLGRPRTARDR